MTVLFVPGHLPLIQADRMLHRELKFAEVHSIKQKGCGVEIEYRKLTPPEIIAELESCEPEPFVI